MSSSKLREKKKTQSRVGKIKQRDMVICSLILSLWNCGRVWHFRIDIFPVSIDRFYAFDLGFGFSSSVSFAFAIGRLEMHSFLVAFVIFDRFRENAPITLHK